MKKFLTMFLFSLMIFACKGAVKPKEGTRPDNTKPNNVKPDNTIPENKIGTVEDIILKKMILKHFALLDSNDENKAIPYAASGAAKKIKIIDTADFKLTAVEHFAYNDKLGTFTVKVTGSIKIDSEMKEFKNQELQFENFKFPIDDTIKIVSLKKLDFDMTEANKHKPSVENFLKYCKNPVTQLIFITQETNKDLGLTELVNFGITHNVSCEPVKAENAQTSTGIKVKLEVLQLFKTNGGQEESKIFPINFKKAEPHLIRDPLFTNTSDMTAEEALEKAKKEIETLKNENKLILVDKEEYASSYWAWIHYVDKMLPSNYMTEDLKELLKKYEKHRIDIGIVHSACEINLKADDFEGTLKIPLVVATTENIADQKNLKDEFIVDLKGFKTVKYEVKDFQEGADKFKAFVLNDENFKFASREKNNIDDLKFNNVEFNEYTMYDTGVAQGYNVISMIERKFPYNKKFTEDYEFVMNGETNAENVLGFIHPQKYPLCKTINGKEIFIKNIKVYKKLNTESCTVKITFMGELPSKVDNDDMLPTIYVAANRVDP